MRHRHPFLWLTKSWRKRATVSLTVLTLALLVGLQVLGGPLVTDVAPYGIVSFELAGELSLAQVMVESWGQTGEVYAGLNLGLDYLFLVAYSLAIGLGCAMVARGLSGRMEPLSVVGVVLAWGLLGAALLDAVENYALIRVLLGTHQELWPVLARWCAIAKFAIVVAGLVYVVAGAIVALVSWARKKNGKAA